MVKKAKKTARKAVKAKASRGGKKKATKKVAKKIVKKAVKKAPKLTVEAAVEFLRKNAPENLASPPAVTEAFNSERRKIVGAISDRVRSKAGEAPTVTEAEPVKQEVNAVPNTARTSPHVMRSTPVR